MTVRKETKLSQTNEKNNESKRMTKKKVWSIASDLFLRLSLSAIVFAVAAAAAAAHIEIAVLFCTFRSKLIPVK